MLVNNVGVSYPHAEYFEAIDDQLIDDLITINIQATNKVRSAFCVMGVKAEWPVCTLSVMPKPHQKHFLSYGEVSGVTKASLCAQMTRIVLPGMKERRKGAIVNIGSAAATVAPSGPLYAVYAGTKVALSHFLLTSHGRHNPQIPGMAQIPCHLVATSGTHLTAMQQAFF